MHQRITLKTCRFLQKKPQNYGNAKAVTHNSADEPHELRVDDHPNP